MKKVYLSALKTITYEETEKPVPYGNRVLINVKATGVCGTDVHGYMGETIFGSMFPFHLGHEVSGIVEAVGPECKQIKVGDHVVIDPLIACGVCDECRNGRSQFCDKNTTIGRTGPGGFSDAVMMPEGEVFSYDPALDYEVACLAEPLSCVLHGIEVAGVGIGQTVLIKGAGGIGQMHLLACKLAGAKFVAVADFNESKLNKAKRLGADYAFDAKTATTEDYLAVSPKGFDVIIDCTGSPKSITSSTPLLRRKGTLLIFGVCPSGSEVTFDPHDVYMRELQIKGSFCFPKATMRKALGLLETGRINGRELISARHGRSELSKVLEDVNKGIYDGKVIIVDDEG